MIVTVFTSNQPRHMALIESLANVADTVYAVQEGTTLFPGKIEDFFRRSPVMQDYFSRVMNAEEEIFGTHRFGPANARQMAMRSGDINMVDLNSLAPALKADIVIVFGASWIKEPLIDVLIEKKAVNIHMGVSPYYRGSSCNFWAPFDGHPEYVGATIHRISKGLDSGNMLYHALPPALAVEPFKLGMLAVKSAHESLVEHIKTGRLKSMTPVAQNRSLEIRYTRNVDFTDDVAQQYLDNLPCAQDIQTALENRNPDDFLSPFIGKRFSPFPRTKREKT